MDHQNVQSLWTTGKQEPSHVERFPIRRRTSSTAENSTAQVRNKRQIIALAALVISCASAFYSASDLLGISTQRDDSEIIKHLHDDEVTLAVDHRSIEILNKSMVAIDQAVKDLKVGVNELGYFIQVDQHTSLIIEEWDRIMEGLSLLALKKLSPRLIHVSSILQNLEEISREVREFGYELDLQDSDDVFNLPVSYLSFRNGTVMVFIHIPARLDAVPVDIFRYVPTPIQVSPGLIGFPEFDERYLITDSSASAFRTLMPFEFSQCQKEGHILRCPGDGVYTSQAATNCLAALYFSKLNDIGTLCKWSFNPTSAFAIQVTGNTFLVYYPEETVLELWCQSGQKQRMEGFKGLRRVIVMPGCRAAGPSFTLYGRIDVTREVSMTMVRLYNPSELLREADTTEVELLQAITALQLVGSHAGISIADIKLKYHASWVQSVLNAILMVGGGIIILGVCFLCICRGRHNVGKALRARYARLSRPSAPPPPAQAQEMHEVGAVLQ